MNVARTLIAFAALPGKLCWNAIAWRGPRGIELSSVTEGILLPHHMRRVPYIDNLVRDFRYGLRALRKNPIFTATVIASARPAWRAATQDPIQALRTE